MRNLKRLWRAAAEHTAAHSRTLWFPIVGGVVATVIARLLGVSVTFFPGMSEGLLRGSLDLAVCILIAYLLLFFGLFVWLAVERAARRRLNWWIVLASFGALVLAGGIIGYLWDQSRGPVIWTWDEAHPITIGRSDSNYGIQAFSFLGRNRSDEPLSRISVSVRSDVTGQTIELAFPHGQMIPAGRVTIPPGEKFTVAYLFPYPLAGMPIPDFKRDFARFRFSFAHDGGEPRIYKFTEQDVDKSIRNGLEAAEREYERLKKMMQPSGLHIRP